jgi:hypothetical protein
MKIREVTDLVSQIEDEMSYPRVVARKLGREALWLALPMLSAIPDGLPFSDPGRAQEANAQTTIDLVNSIRPRTDHLSDGDPDMAADVEKVLSGIRNTLYEDEPLGFGNATGHLQHWRGASADAFKGYLNRTDGDYRKAQDALNDLALLYGLYGKIMSQCHADLILVLTAGLRAFQDADGQVASVPLATASTVLSMLTAGESLILISLVGAMGGVSMLVATANITSSTDVGTAKSIVDGLETIKNNTITRLKQVGDTVDELTGKAKEAAKDVLDNLPDFAKPGQRFRSGEFAPENPPPSSRPISDAPLIPATQSSTDIAQRLDPS